MRRLLGGLDEADLVAVTDVVVDRAERFAARHGSAHAGSLQELLAMPNVQVVCICPPSGLHAEIGLAVAEAGKHVVVEKPIDISLAAAETPDQGATSTRGEPERRSPSSAITPA